MKNLLSYQYWFNFRPQSFPPLIQTTLVVMTIVLFILTLVFLYLKSRLKKSLFFQLWLSLYYFCLTNTIIALVLLFFNYEMLPFLSARFWFILWAAVIIVWLFFVGKRVIIIPAKRVQLEKEKLFKKYLP